MEALAAIGLASNLAQFVGYAIDITRLAVEIKKSAGGAPEEELRIKAIWNSMSANLKSLEEAASRDPSIISGEDQLTEELMALIKRCIRVSADIGALVSKVSNMPSKNMFQSVYKASSTVSKRKEIKELTDWLFMMRAEVSNHLISQIRQQQRSFHGKMESFTDASQSHQIHSASSLEAIMKTISTIQQQYQTISTKPLPGGGSTHVPEQSEVLRKNAGLDDWYIAMRADFEDRKREQILGTLHFGQLKDREYAVTDAHTKTFQWIFERDTSFGFQEWLVESSNRIYWISGKAGSGKSTLMKFLRHHYTTSKLGFLKQSWANGANDHDVVIATHFFWYAGTRIQKSQEGLYRALLLQILKQRPELFELVCGDRWAAPYGAIFDRWSVPQLKTAFGAIASIVNANFKIFLLIDGLDEFDGEPPELIQTLCDFAESPHIKICASSRPRTDFSDAFDGGPMLRLQELTLEDMQTFVREELQQNSRFQSLQKRNMSAAGDLITEIISKADGVFLWTFLVVREVSRGLRFEDSISDLRWRVQALPSDLSEFFDRMVEGIENVYRQRASRLFITIARSQMSFPVLAFMFLNFEDMPLDLEPLSFLANWPDVNADRFEVLYKKKRQLISQCKDLIFVSADPEASSILFEDRVSFLHKTVVDYIQTTEVMEKLERLAGGKFDSNVILFQANLSQTRLLMHAYSLTYIAPRLGQWILGCLFFAYQIEVSTGVAETAGLDELEQLIETSFGRWTFSHAMWCLPGLPRVDSFLQLVCACDLSTYVRQKIHNCSAVKLDELAPGWRSPMVVQLDTKFELRRLQLGRQQEIEWRLGLDLQATAERILTGGQTSSLFGINGVVLGRPVLLSTQHGQSNTVGRIQAGKTRKFLGKLPRLLR